MTFGMVIMIPLIQLLLFGYAINTKVRDLPVAVVNEADNALSRVLIQTIEATGVVQVTQQFATISEAEAELVQENVRAILYIPPDVSHRIVRHPALNKGIPESTQRTISRPIAQWIVDGSDTVVAGAIKSLSNMPLRELVGKDANRKTPTFSVSILYNPEQRTVVNIVPGLTGVILTMTMVMFTSAAIVRERERGNLELLIATPIRPIELMLGKIIPYVFIGFIQVAIILALGHQIFSVPINGEMLDLAVATFLFISATLSLGLIISTLAKSQLQSMQMTVFVLLPSILLSGFMFPYHGMPRVAQLIAEVLPATHFIRSIRAIVLRDSGLFDLGFDMLWLLCFTLVGLFIASMRFKKHL
jgi:ABC-2 type transport system permease protein